MKTVALTSDTHGYLPRITDGVSFVLHAGDIGVDRDPIRWFREVFYPWARAVTVPVYATFGNHDRIAERQMLPEGQPKNLRFLKDELLEIAGVNVWFSPWSVRYGDWAFMANERTLHLKYAKIPLKTDVIVSHTPPLGQCDLNVRQERLGSGALTDRMTQLDRLKLVVCGHVHEAFGQSQFGNVTILNVCHVNEWYEPAHDPVIIPWPPQHEKTGMVADVG